MSMRQMFGLVLITLFVIACGGGAPENNSPKKTVKKKQSKAKKVDGAKIYKQYCVTCHGIDGDMGASGAFNLTTSTLTVDEKIEVITNGRNTMTPFKGLLSDEKIKAVADYTETLKK